jgi:hypothetical protein
MALHGDFQTMSGTELLQWIALTEKTGLLTVDGPYTLQLSFRDGKIVATSCFDDERRVAAWLVRLGAISPEESGKAVEVAEAASRPVGELLLDIGAIDSGDLAAMYRFKAEEELAEMLGWSGARFEFVADESLLRRESGIRVDPMEVVINFVRLRDETAFTSD